MENSLVNSQSPKLIITINGSVENKCNKTQVSNKRVAITGRRVKLNDESLSSDHRACNSLVKKKSTFTSDKGVTKEDSKEKFALRRESSKLDVESNNIAKNEAIKRKKVDSMGPTECKNIDSIVTLECKKPIVCSKSESEIPTELQCTSCSMTFSTSFDLKKHMAIHKKENIHTCTFCFKTFKQSNHLFLHQKVHLKNDSLQCELCYDTFKSKMTLNQHMKRHLNEKAFLCDVCPTAFHRKYELKTHMIKHTENLPYICEICGDKFATTTRLTRHSITHTEEKPFKCEVCGNKFSNQFSLNSHKGVHLSKSSFPCDVCGQIFARLSYLTLHKRVHKTNNTYSYIAQHKINKTGTNPQSSLHREPKTKVNDSHLHDELLEIKCTNTKEISNMNPDFPNRDPESEIKDVTENKRREAEIPDSLSKSNLTDSMKLSSMSQDFLHQKVDSNCTTKVEGASKKRFNEGFGITSSYPNYVQAALSSGTFVETQTDDGKNYLIVLPKSFAQNDCTLFAACSVPEAVKPDDKIIKGKGEFESNRIPLKRKEEYEENYNFLVSDNSLDSFSHVPLRQTSEGSHELNKAKKLKQQKGTTEDDIIIANKLSVNRVESSSLKRKLKNLKKKIGGKSYHCHECNKNCKTLSYLNVHMRTHSGERPFYCDYCGKGFKQSAHLQSHVRIHTGETPYKCSLCRLAFNQSSRLRYHMHRVHFPVKRKRKKDQKHGTIRNFYCKICDKTFIDSCFKINHMKTHLEDRKKESREEFTKNAMLEEPVDGGIDEDLSERKFSSLTQHKRTSNKSKLHSCKSDVPNERAILNSEIQSIEKLRRTSLIRNDIIPDKAMTSKIELLFKDGKFECCICSKVFNLKSNALKHLKIHSGIRPYKCNECGKAFKQISHLKGHVILHTGEKPFKCSVCSFTFTSSSSARVHIKKYHDSSGFVINDRKDMKEQESIVFEKVVESNDIVLINFEMGKATSIECKRLDDVISVTNNELF